MFKIKRPLAFKEPPINMFVSAKDKGDTDLLNSKVFVFVEIITPSLSPLNDVSPVHHWNQEKNLLQ